MDIRNINDAVTYTTKDGSEIREILRDDNSCIRNQSLAEASLPIGAISTPHYHSRSEEIYYILAGRGRMRLGSETRDVGPGDAIAIPPGQVHQITNSGDEVLRFLCCCAPGYTHDDTVLLG